MKYYDIQKNWRKVKPCIDLPKVQNVLVRDFNRFTWGNWRQKFTYGDKPTKFESCDWRYGKGRGRQPAFWNYTKHAACHWLVNFNLMVAQAVEPSREWRILTSDKHSTVWDGKETLFDFNFSALGICPKECFEMANDEMLAPGKLHKTHLATFWRHQKS